MSEYESNIDFDWEQQLKWKGKCRSNNIQSPIDISKPNIIVSKQKDFAISYNFYDVFPIISRRFNEAIVKFSNHPGMFKISLNNNLLLFKPKFISFRFPGEHSMSGKKFNGEMLLHLRELNPDKKRRLINSLIITIPFDNNKDTHNFSPLEPLNIDFWKYSLQKKNNHNPTDYMSEQKTVFSLTEIFNQITISQSKFYFYLGSETVPPCTGIKLLLKLRVCLPFSRRKTRENIKLST